MNAAAASADRGKSCYSVSAIISISCWRTSPPSSVRAAAACSSRSRPWTAQKELNGSSATPPKSSPKPSSTVRLLNGPTKRRARDIYARRRGRPSEHAVQGDLNEIRFAPRPTGYLHLGNARTAVLNYLLARKYDATTCLRRGHRHGTKHARVRGGILTTLRWLASAGTWPDAGGEFGPYRQSSVSTLEKIYRHSCSPKKRPITATAPDALERCAGGLRGRARVRLSGKCAARRREAALEHRAESPPCAFRATMKPSS